MEYVCGACGAVYPRETMAYRCRCGGLFSLRYGSRPVDFASIKTRGPNTLWRYAAALPFAADSPAVRAITMGEGFTPLVSLGEGGRPLGKCDYYMPTLSFKDRGAVMLVAEAKTRGMKRLVSDSSGNAATAIAAYSARAGIACECFVPEGTSDKKIKQISAYGAAVHVIPGTREDAARAAIDFVGETGAFYASHIFNPLFYEGTKTYFFELYEQLGGKLPDAVVVPVGNGTLLLGAYRAFEQLLAWGLIEKMPPIYAVQAAGCAPIQHAFEEGLQSVQPCENRGTRAEGIAIAAPARGADILNAVRRTGGDIIAIQEEDIFAAHEALARQGLFVEITSAVNYAGYLEYFDRIPSFAKKCVVLPLCGAGLKSC